MPLKYPLIITLLLAAVMAFALLNKDPHLTPLPDGIDLAPVRHQLSKLPEDERKLVIDYMERTRGEGSTPDASPAHTFADAITAQRSYAANPAASNPAVASGAPAANDTYAEARAAMHAATSVELVKRAIVASRDLREAGAYSAIKDGSITDVVSGDTPVFVVVFRLHNLAAMRISQVIGSVDLGTTQDGILVNCTLNHYQSLWDGQSVDIYCHDTDPSRSPDKKRALVQASESNLVMNWMPETVSFENGKHYWAPPTAKSRSR